MSDFLIGLISGLSANALFFYICFKTGWMENTLVYKILKDSVKDASEKIIKEEIEKQNKAMFVSSLVKKLGDRS